MNLRMDHYREALPAAAIALTPKHCRRGPHAVAFGSDKVERAAEVWRPPAHSPRWWRRRARGNTACLRERRGEMRTDAKPALASDRGVPEGLATPTLQRNRDRIREVQRVATQSRCRPDRCSRNTRSLRASACSLERSSSCAVHGVEARASGRRKAAASRPVQCAHENTSMRWITRLVRR